MAQGAIVATSKIGVVRGGQGSPGKLAIRNPSPANVVRQFSWPVPLNARRFPSRPSLLLYVARRCRLNNRGCVVDRAYDHAHPPAVSRDLPSTRGPPFHLHPFTISFPALSLSLSLIREQRIPSSSSGSHPNPRAVLSPAHRRSHAGAHRWLPAG